MNNFLLFQDTIKLFQKSFSEILGNRERYPWAVMRRTCIPNFIPIGRWERGEKSEEPKTREKSGEKILVLDAKYADFKRS